jgi:hypothetical protein
MHAAIAPRNLAKHRAIVGVVLTGVILAALVLLAPAARAVSYPDGEVSGNRAPYVASIMWVKDSGDWAGKTVRNSCTGTYVAQGYVITAAHCVEGTEPENLYVGTGPNVENLGYCAVLSFEDHPRYTKGRVSVNDIALMRVTTGCEPRKFPKIATGGVRYRGLYLYGWGLNQDSEEPLELGKLRVTDYSSMGRDFYGGSFNPAMQIAAGRWFANEEIFGGACYGDSGGPLIAQNGARATLVGVVSWGTSYRGTCRPTGPTVYANMAAYSSWLSPAYKRISRLIGDKYYTYAKLGTNGNVGDGIDYGQAIVVSNSKTTMFEWNYIQSAAPVGPVAWTFGIDTDFDGVANLNGTNVQITDVSGAVLCTAISDKTEPIKGINAGFSRDVIFPTDCIRKSRQIGDVHMGLTAGGVAESIVVDAVAFPPAS